MLDPSGTHRAIAHLEVANEAILEAFSRALDLRDGQPPGHTQAVAELAVRLARGMGLAEPELTQIKYGASFTILACSACRIASCRRPDRSPKKN
jgi:response regulator RpfG family c-di-GMP phosphodiesterase